MKQEKEVPFSMNVQNNFQIQQPRKQTMVIENLDIMALQWLGEGMTNFVDIDQ